MFKAWGSSSRLGTRVEGLGCVHLYDLFEPFTFRELFYDIVHKQEPEHGPPKTIVPTIGTHIKGP